MLCTRLKWGSSQVQSSFVWLTYRFRHVLPSNGAHYNIELIAFTAASTIRTDTPVASSAEPDPQHLVPARSKRESSKIIPGRSLCSGKKDPHSPASAPAPRRRHRVGRDIVWEGNEHVGGGGGGYKPRDLVACGLWATTWLPSREVSRQRMFPPFSTEKHRTSCPRQQDNV